VADDVETPETEGPPQWAVLLLEQNQKLVEAKLKSLLLEEEQLRARQREAQAEERRAAYVEQLFSKVGEQIQAIYAQTQAINSYTEAVSRANDLMVKILNSTPPASAIEELATAISRRIERIEVALMFVLPYIPDRSGQKEKLARDLQTAAEDFDHKEVVRLELIATRKELAIYHKNLSDKREEAARHGINTPTQLRNEIEEYERKIAELETKIKQLQADLGPN